MTYYALLQDLIMMVEVDHLDVAMVHHEKDLLLYEHNSEINLLKRNLLERGLGNCIIGGGGGGITGPFELFDDDDESLLLPK